MKHCPFCSNSITSHRDLSIGGLFPEKTACHVFCVFCGACGPACSSEDQADEQWDRRGLEDWPELYAWREMK